MTKYEEDIHTFGEENLGKFIAYSVVLSIMTWVVIIGLVIGVIAIIWTILN
jgi:hypothetical protein